MRRWLKRLNLAGEDLVPRAHRAEVFSGNRVPDAAKPIALAYAGHQFGGLSPQLGDGRAHLLGELPDQQGITWDVQLKGSEEPVIHAVGWALRTWPGSQRVCDERSDALLGVPTSRSLAVVTTGETLWREGSQPGAVVTRVARSHIRVGTFEYYALQNNTQALKAWQDYALARHYPELRACIKRRSPLPALLEAILDRQIDLIVEWLRVGFIHGVMNTDNCTISGIRLISGPCAMLGSYGPATVFSSIDTRVVMPWQPAPDCPLEPDLPGGSHVATVR